MESETKRYLSLIDSGLGRAARPLKVVVVGAGMAGLTAAHELRRAGHSPIVLEARQRVGGRIETFREPFSDGLHAEAGAMRLPAAHRLTAAYIRRFNLPTQPFVSSHPMGWCYLNGRRVRMGEAERHPERMGFDLDPHERGHGPAARLREAIEPLVRRIRKRGDAAWPEIVREYDEYSIRDFLKSCGWSETAIEMFGLLNNYESLMNTSFVEMLRDDMLMTGPDLSQIVGGMDRLPRAFLPELAGCLRFGSAVYALEQKTSSVVVHYRTAGGAFAETADAVVLTVPFPILRHVAVQPQFSAAKRKAIRELHYDYSAKIFLQFRRRFWESEDGIIGGKTVTDLPVRVMHYPSGGGDDGRGILLASYTWGPDSQRWSALPPRERISRALDNVAAVHGPEVRELFEAGAFKSWHDDEYAGGAYALFQPGQQTTLHDDIVRPEGRIHFAGEHTTLKHAWIEGAVESGLRAAEEVHGLARSLAPSNGGTGKAVIKQVRLRRKPAGAENAGPAEID